MKKLSLAWQILIGLILGIVVGFLFYGNDAFATYLKPIGDIFIRLIKMIVVPIVVASLVIGISSVGDTKKLGRLGGKTILYFEIVTTIALGIGLLVANVFKPGVGVSLDNMAKVDLAQYEETAHTHTFMDTIINIVPTNVFDAIARGDMLAIVFFSVMFGLGVAAIGEKGKPVVQFFEGVSETMFWVTNQIMKVAPLAVFALIGVTVSQMGLSALIPLGKLVLSVFGGLLLFVSVVFGIIAKIARIKLWSIVKLLKDELLLVFSTGSSETVLPKIMEKMEMYGCPKSITSFVIPTGYTFNLDGSSIYQGLAVLFIAQMYNVPLSIGEQITVLLVLMLASKGMAGVTGASLVVVLTTLTTMNLPVEGLAFIASVDRILDGGRAVVNVLGNSLATIVMAKWEGVFGKEDVDEKYLYTQPKSKTEVM